MLKEKYEQFIYFVENNNPTGKEMEEELKTLCQDLTKDQKAKLRKACNKWLGYYFKSKK